MNFVISGYYGFNNSGDDALLMSIIKNIKDRYNNAEITVLSKKPKSTKKVYGIDSCNRYNLFSVILKILKCDILISGGGTLIQDATSTKSLLYYLAVIKVAQLFGKKTMLYANGIGPLNSFRNIEKTRVVLNQVDLITLRDESSVVELQHIGVTKPKIELTADPAFLLEANKNGRKILDSYNVPTDKEYLCISVRDWKGNPENFADNIAEFCDYAYNKYNLYTVLMPMQHSIDYELAISIKNKMKNRSTVLGTKLPIESILSVISQMHICVGMRLHSLIYSANALVPTIGLVYDPKVSGFMDYIKEERYIDVENIELGNLKSMLDDVQENYDTIKSHMKFNIRELRKKAEINNELLDELLGGKR